MIAFGTVSGGVGARLTGGNFWQGAAIGLVVSGLNHAMHKMQESSKLDKSIRAGGYDPDDTARLSNDGIGEFASKVFPNMYADANCPSFEVQDVIGGNDNIYGQAQKNVYKSSSGKYTIASKGNILNPLGVIK